MVKVILKLLILCLLSFHHIASAAVDPADFNGDVEMHERYRALTQTLRCPKCQNQNIAGSDAPIALDMRHKVEELLHQGKTNQEIEQFMIDRYGDYVTYDPPFKSRTYLLWCGPLLFFLIVIIGFWISFRNKDKQYDYEN